MTLPRVKHWLSTCALALACACVLTLVPACGGGEADAWGGGDPPATGADFTPAKKANVPDVSGVAPTSIDVSTANDGYVATAAESASRLKFQVTNGELTYNYDMPNDGTPAIYPINMGDGPYTFRIMQNTEGNNYVELDSATADISLKSEFAPFLLPNWFCSYTASSAAVSKAKDLVASSTNEGEALSAICTHVVQNVSYDVDKAEKLSTLTGYAPNPDETLSTGKGVCFDYSSLAAAMLRSQGIPTKIITGYVDPGNLYHAWIMAYIDGTWKTVNFDVQPKAWSRLDLTFASTGGSSFVGSGVGYTDRYTY